LNGANAAVLAPVHGLELPYILLQKGVLPWPKRHPFRRGGAASWTKAVNQESRLP